MALPKFGRQAKVATPVETAAPAEAGADSQLDNSADPEATAVAPTSRETVDHEWL